MPVVPLSLRQHHPQQLQQPQQPQQPQQLQQLQQPQQPQEKHIIVLDLDGTVVGDVSYALMRHQLLSTIRKNHLRGPSPIDTLIQNLIPGQGLLRPGFKEFMKRYADHEIFVFTASEKNWAHVVLNCIEKAAGVRFNRPFFTRDDCVQKGTSLTKNFNLIKHKVVASIKRRRGTTLNPRHKVTVIDNAPVWENPFIQCPSYTFIGFIDLLEDIPRQTLLNPALRPIVQTLISQGHCYDCYKSFELDGVKSLLYRSSFLAKKSRQVYTTNMASNQYKDQFWSRCIVEHL